MVAVVCALFDEAWELIRRLEMDQTTPITHYRGRLEGTEIALLLVKPGFRKKKEFRRWVRENRFSRLINIGFAGALHSDLRLGQICPISRVVHSGKQTSLEVTGGLSGDSTEGFSLVQADQPLFSLDDKEDLHLRSGADLVDMESATLLTLIHELREEKITLQPEIIKIVGDLPGEKLYLEKEQTLRAWFSSFGWRKKARLLVQSGAWFFALYFRKRKLQRILASALREALAKGACQAQKGGAS